MEKLREAAIKSKIIKDQTEEFLNAASLDDNSQTSTTLMHSISALAYNYQEWKKIKTYIYEKLKLKKWRVILKILNLAQFLLKNGPPNAIQTFKHEVHLFKSFNSVNSDDDDCDKVQSIKQRANSIVELLVNDELLEEERVKSRQIKQKMSEAMGSISKPKNESNRRPNNQNQNNIKTTLDQNILESRVNYDQIYRTDAASNNLNKYKKAKIVDPIVKKEQEIKVDFQPLQQQTIQVVQHKPQTQKVIPKAFNQVGIKLRKPGQINNSFSNNINKIQVSQKSSLKCLAEDRATEPSQKQNTTSSNSLNNQFKENICNSHQLVTQNVNMIYNKKQQASNKDVDDQFGVFDQGSHQVKWLSSQQSNLIDLTIQGLTNNMNQYHLNTINLEYTNQQSFYDMNKMNFSSLSNCNINMKSGGFQPNNQHTEPPNLCLDLSGFTFY